MKTKKIFVFMISCALIFGVFAGSTFCSSAAQVNYLSQTNYLQGVEYNNSLRLESEYGTISTSWNPDTFLTFTNQQIFDAFGVSSGRIKMPGSEVGNRLFMYPYNGADFVFPSVDGVVDHYELQFRFLIEDCASANMYRARYGSTGSSQYLPFLSVDNIQLQYYNTSGTLSSFNVGGSSPEVSYIFSINRDGEVSTYTAEDVYFWDNYDFSYPVLCTLTISTDSFKNWRTDFVNITGADIYFGGGCFFYSYGFDMSDPYFRLRPTAVHLTTVYMTREDYAAIQKEEEYRDNVSSGLDNIQSALDDDSFSDGGVSSGLEDMKDALTPVMPDEIPVEDGFSLIEVMSANVGSEMSSFFGAFVQPINIVIWGHTFDLFSVFFTFLGFFLVLGLVFLILRGSHSSGSNKGGD